MNKLSVMSLNLFIMLILYPSTKVAPRTREREKEETGKTKKLSITVF